MSIEKSIIKRNVKLLCVIKKGKKKFHKAVL